MKMLRLFIPLYGIFRRHKASDLADFLISRVLSDVLFILAILTAILQYLWRPVECFYPQAFSEVQTRYAGSYCQDPLAEWSPYSSNGNIRRTPRFRSDIIFPLLLFWHAILLRIPAYIRLIISHRSDIHFGNLIRSASCYKTLDETGKKVMARTTATLIYANYSKRPIGDARGLVETLKRLKQRVMGILPIGILALAAILGSLLLAIFTTGAFYELGGFLIQGAKEFDPWNELMELATLDNVTAFPTVIICHFPVLGGGTLQTYSIQCYLPLSLLYSRISVILIYTYMLAQPLAWIVFIHRLITLILPWSRIMFIHKCLKQPNPTGIQQENTLGQEPMQFTVNVDNFMKNHILMDGYYLLKSISEKVDDLFVYDVVNELWQDVNYIKGENGHPAVPMHTGFQTEHGVMKEPLLLKQVPEITSM